MKRPSDLPDNVLIYLNSLADAYLLAPQHVPQDWAKGKIYWILETECERYKVSMDAIVSNMKTAMGHLGYISPIVDEDE